MDLFEMLNEIEYTHRYIFSYIEKGNIYASFVEDASDLLPLICDKGRESTKSGGGVAYHFRPNQKQRDLIKSVAVSTVYICTEKEMEESRASYERHLNRGQFAEIVIARHFNGKLNDKPNADLTSGADIEINGIEYQIKFNRATVCGETPLTNLYNKVR